MGKTESWEEEETALVSQCGREEEEELVIHARQWKLRGTSHEGSYQR